MNIYFIKTASYDVVASCFFLDTAHNVIEYLENIWKVLKPGGVLVNLGPLLYHFQGVGNEASIELSLEDVLDVARQIGFELLHNEVVTSNYTCNTKSMLTYEYKCALFVAKKP